MAYTDFTLEAIKQTLGLIPSQEDIFHELTAVDVPTWLGEFIGRGTRQVLLSDKARSEFLVTPILLACQELSPSTISIYSGQRLGVDPGRGLIGECDFILANSPILPSLQSPVMLIVEAKRHDVEGGIWQCFAQMEAARLFNERNGRTSGEMSGCVTNGENWQFLRLSGNRAEIDFRKLYIDNVGGILAAFGRTLNRPHPALMPAG